MDKILRIDMGAEGGPNSRPTPREITPEWVGEH